MKAARLESAAAPAPVGGVAKRVLDVVCAALALLFFAPLMLFIAAAVRLQDGGPAFFGHSRLGFGGRGFRCLKFRSMAVDGQSRLEALLAASPEARAEWEATQKLRKDPRVTPLGAFLRRSSLDELPQLLNILFGQMSFVGPRPIVTAEVARYGGAFEDYAKARPGLTGLWQISGRSDTSYDSRVALDCAYVRRWTFGQDILIIAKTVPAVLSSRGSY